MLMSLKSSGRMSSPTKKYRKPLIKAKKIKLDLFYMEMDFENFFIPDEAMAVRWCNWCVGCSSANACVGTAPCGC